MPGLVQRHLGKKVFSVYNVLLLVLMILVGAVFIYTPGDIFVANVLGQKPDVHNPVVWIVYAVIFIYYLCATLFPIDKIIGRIYPIFGLILLLSAVGIGFGIFFKGYPLQNVTAQNWMGIHPKGLPLIPIFFVTVACGITSGFHSTQATLIARSVTSEREGRHTFYNMMILEGFIAMIWAAAAMGIYAKGVPSDMVGKPAIIGVVAHDMLGTVGGLIAILGVIVLPITSGDTALRAVRLMLAELLNYDQSKAKNRVILSACIFTPVILLLFFAKLNADGFNVLWQYFAWANQTIAVFAFAMIGVYMIKNELPYIMSLVPGMFYMFVISSYLLNAKIGFNLPFSISYPIAGILTIIYAYMIVRAGKKAVQHKTKLA